MSKRAKAQRKHVKRRALERFGLILSDEDVDGLIERVKSGEAIFVHTHEDTGRTSYLMEYEGEQAVWVYDPKTEQLVTVVTIGMFGCATARKRQKQKVKDRQDEKKAQRKHERMVRKLRERQGWK